MARLGRYFVVGQALHVIQRGNDRRRIFFGEEDYLAYGTWLGEAARAYGCAIHAYVLTYNRGQRKILRAFLLARHRSGSTAAGEADDGTSRALLPTRPLSPNATRFAD